MLRAETRTLRRVGKYSKAFWESEVIWLEPNAREMALILCDVWDQHWSDGAQARLEDLVPRINQDTCRCRSAGMTVIHAPSGTMDFYKDEPARLRAKETKQELLPVESLTLPSMDQLLDISDGGSDTGGKFKAVWTRQHPGIEIKSDTDYISDDADEIRAILVNCGVKLVILAGVHLNICLIRRPFGIAALKSWGFDVVVAGELTDVMYNPEMFPYVNHGVALEMGLNFCRQFWCPTVCIR